MLSFIKLRDGPLGLSYTTKYSPLDLNIYKTLGKKCSVDSIFVALPFNNSFQEHACLNLFINTLLVS